MTRSLLVLMLGWMLAGACASSGEVRCKPSDNSIAFCEIGSHEECEDLDNGCQRCTCVLDRPEEIEHGPVGPR